MRKIIAVLALLTPLMLAPLRAHAGPTEDFRAKFKTEEQWMLDVILSDPKKKAAFDISAVAAAKSADDLQREMMTWRKTVISFVQYYKKHLDSTDIVGGADSVEKMVTPEEFNVTQYFWLRQPKAEQDQMKSDIATGNNLLSFGGRKLVESKVRAGRVKFSGRLDGYLNDVDSRAALAWTPPPPKPAPVETVPLPAPQPVPAAPAPAPKPTTTHPAPKPVAPPASEPKPEPVTTAPPANPNGARDQLDNVARNQTPGGSPERQSEQSGSGYTGAGGHQTSPVTPVDTTAGPPAPAAPSAPLPASSLTPSAGDANGGFVVAAPPSPVLDQQKPHTEGGSKAKIMLVKYGPPVLGAVLGGALLGILGALFLGPIGAIAGAALGAALGWKGGGMLAKKLLS